jgi:hypothetical protein
MSFNVITGLGGAVTACGAIGMFTGQLSKVAGTAIMAVGVLGFSLMNAYSKELSAAATSLKGRVEKAEAELPEGVKETAKSGATILAIGAGMTVVVVGAVAVGALAYIGYIFCSLIANHRN